MIGKLIGAAIGDRVAKSAGAAGPAGALLGATAVAAARRLSPVTLVALALGGYAWKKYSDKRHGATVPPGGKQVYQGEGGTSA